jgi:uncharacterized membrane-anchored protein YjiN (DUF445 family)
MTPGEERRARLLVVTRRRATGLLVFVAIAFALSTAFQPQAHWLTWIQAAALASLVGGLADWFAVTALFRRPLGLPIPHTAIVVERKDRFAETLGTFVQESFLSPEAVIARLRTAGALPRAAAWLADEGNAKRLAAQASEGLATAAGLLSDADVNEVLDALVRRRLEDVTLAPLAGKALEQVTRDGRHDPLIDAALEGLADYLHEHGAELHFRLGVQSPWWLPGPVSSRMVRRLLIRTEDVVTEMAANRNHPLRRQLDDAITHLSARLQVDPGLRRRGEELKEELLAQPTVRGFAASIWEDVKKELRAQSADPGSPLRTGIVRVVCDTGRRLQEDPELAASAERSVQTVVRVVLSSFADELIGLITGTIARWDASDTSRRLELLLGPDLQYIRINGTVVGGLAGLALHAVAVAAG